jgi:hypothetical protein
VHCGHCVRLLNQRKRKIPDITARFWRLALVCLIASALLLAALYFVGQLLSSVELQQRAPVIIGILMIYGFAGSVIMGMLQTLAVSFTLVGVADVTDSGNNGVFYRVCGIADGGGFCLAGLDPGQCHPALPQYRGAYRFDAVVALAGSCFSHLSQLC